MPASPSGIRSLSRCRRRAFGLGALLACLPLAAHANAAITLFILATAAHMFYGNAVLGLLEGGLLIWIFRTHWLRALPVMMVANYVSAWGGLWGLGLLPSGHRADIHSPYAHLAHMVVVCYLLTLFMEWPFVAFCLKGHKRWLSRSIWASLLVQTISYGILVGWYVAASDNSLFTEVEIVSADEIAFPENLALYYIAEEDGNVYQRTLGSREDTLVARLATTDTAPWLELEEIAPDTGRWQLRAANTLIATDIACDVARPPDDERMVRGDDLVPRIGTARQSAWTFECNATWGIWLDGSREKPSAETIRLACEMPHAVWRFFHVVHLPGDLVVFELGGRQICVLDAPHRKLALLTYGHSPVVVIPRQPEPPLPASPPE